MAIQLTADKFLEAARSMPVFDVRSEGEFAAGHVPGAFSLPLFNNAERAEVGTLYKQQGRQQAILKGLEYAGARMHLLAATALEKAQDGKVAVHCWRGGMRSASVAWLMERVGLSVSVLTGGYKAFRRLMRDEFVRQRRLIILGGKTGSQKTRILTELAARGVEVIDLEHMANHRGSAFGYMDASGPALGGIEGQPTQEQFENALGSALWGIPADRPVIVEDESRLIGRMHIPDAFWKQMRSNRVYVLEWPLETRVAFLTEQYQADTEVIRNNLQSIKKRLGDERTKRAFEALEAGDRAEVCRIVLDYYDRAYAYGLSQRSQELISYLPGENATEAILSLLS
ncbi:MAG: tRNA 2-selenouridine(34) synthase MnmH [Leptospiraceae bacterium]|nr:tRNA 2-selenouridine(34) synthase MnmH [Leptospiraceae bacterium]